MYLSLPFTFISFAFYFYALPFHRKHIEFLRMFVSNYVIVLGSFHDLPCPFMLFPVLYFFQRSSILLYSLLYFNAFHFLPLSFHVRFFHVLPFSVHILSLSLHVMPRISQIDYSECVTVAIVVVTLYRCENEKKSKIHTYKSNSFRVRAISLSFLFIFLSCIFFSPVSFLSLPSMFLPFPSIISLSYVHLI